MFGAALVRTAAVARQIVPQIGISRSTNRIGASMSSAAGGAKHLGRLFPNETALLVRAAEALQLPVIVTEQYPKALGNTIVEVGEVLPEGSLVVAKTKFSMCVDEVVAAIDNLPHVKSVIITGLETHVCVLQTTLDLLEKGYDVHILTDGVSSQRLTDRSTALHRLSQAGAFMATSEMVMFDMMRNTTHPAFKVISGLCKESRPEQLPAF